MGLLLIRCLVCDKVLGEFEGKYRVKCKMAKCGVYNKGDTETGDQWREPQPFWGHGIVEDVLPMQHLANTGRWQLSKDAQVGDEERKEINEYIDRAINRPFTGIPEIQVVDPVRLYCPHCSAEFHITHETKIFNGHYSCNSCGLDVTTFVHNLIK